MSVKNVSFGEKPNGEKVEKYIKEELKIYNLENYSELVLGCTHFPFFKETLAKIFPKETKIIDGSLGVANRLKNVLKENNMLANNILKIEYYYSGKLVKEDKNLNELLQMAK